MSISNRLKDLKDRLARGRDATLGTFNFGDLVKQKSRRENVMGLVRSGALSRVQAEAVVNNASHLGLTQIELQEVAAFIATLVEAEKLRNKASSVACGKCGGDGGAGGRCAHCGGNGIEPSAA